MTRSERIVAALQQLEQFLAVVAQGEAVCALSGVRVTAVPDLDDVGHGLVNLTFPGAAQIEANGDAYLHLKAIESARLEVDGAEGGGKVADRVRVLLAHLKGKHSL